MIRFKGFDFDDTARYSEYLGKSIQIPSDLSPLKIFALRVITEENDNMDILRGYEADLCWHKVLFGDSEYWAAPMGDWDAVDWRDVFEKNVPAGTTFRLVPEYLANLWKKKLGGAVTITEDRDSWDYILSMDRLKDPESGTLEQFRRYRNVFQENYEYTIEEFSPDVFDELREFQTETEEDIESSISDSEAANFFENGLLFVLDSWDAFPEAFKSLYGFLIKVDDECVAYVINERIDASNVIGTFYGAKSEYEGINEFAYWLDAKRNSERGILTVNIMNDIGEPHLRDFKENLSPLVMLRKYTVTYDPAAADSEPVVHTVAAKGLWISALKEGRKLMVALSGRLDTSAAPGAQKEILGALGDVTELVYDLENLEYISSAGLRILIASLKEMKAKDGSMTLINVSEGVREILDLTGFGLILDIQ
ncbi:MAG: anti-sigma factor antagonist [Lachnospiraceae bacterium]|jgi:anti-sigma B factor antagonist|nr:anti-sigma factor antagonist [Lachnospiraceae bacterium]